MHLSSFWSLAGWLALLRCNSVREKWQKTAHGWSMHQSGGGLATSKRKMNLMIEPDEEIFKKKRNGANFLDFSGKYQNSPCTLPTLCNLRHVSCPQFDWTSGGQSVSSKKNSSTSTLPETVKFASKFLRIIFSKKLIIENFHFVNRSRSA